MYIIPMNGITPLDILSQSQKAGAVEKTDESTAASFSNVFKQALQNVEDTQRVSQEDSLKVALGEVDDLHTVQINLQKAQAAVDVFVTMKNTAMDAYKEIMSLTF